MPAEGGPATHPVRLAGRGSVEVVAYGAADAEHLVEKEIRRLWPGASVAVLEIARADDAPRIAEAFRIAYRVAGTLAPAADTPAEARRAALRELRQRFAGSRYARVEWEVT